MMCRCFSSNTKDEFEYLAGNNYPSVSRKCFFQSGAHSIAVPHHGGRGVPTSSSSASPSSSQIELSTTPDWARSPTFSSSPSAAMGTGAGAGGMPTSTYGVYNHYNHMNNISDNNYNFHNNNNNNNEYNESTTTINTNTMLNPQNPNTESDGMEHWYSDECDHGGYFNINDDHMENNHDTTNNPFYDERLLKTSPMHFLQQILIQNDEQRIKAIDNITRILKETLNSNDPSPVISLIPMIAHYAHDAPFEDIRQGFSELLDYIKKCKSLEPAIPSSPRVPPCAFVEAQDLVTIDTSDQDAQELLQGLFLTTGRLSHLARVVLWHPTFAKFFYSTLATLTRGEGGPLPLQWRNYIAILAAARHGCRYLVRQQEEEFRLNGGNEAWLRGIDAAPVKIQNLQHFNALLAHQPWRIRRHHVEALVKGSDSWSLSELVHAITIMCTFHSLCGLVFGLGVLPEDEFVHNTVHHYNFEYFDHNLHSNDSENNSNHNKYQSSISKNQSSFSSSSSLFSSSNNFMDENTLFFQRLQKEQEQVPEDPTERNKVFENVEQHKPDNGDEEEENRIKETSTQHNTKTWQHYTGEYSDVIYKDFDVRSREYRVFRGQEFSWQEHAYSLMAQFCPGVPPLLQDEFSRVRSLTYHQFNQAENVDTQRLRDAVWFYVQRLYGIMYDDFNHSEVNLFLNIGLKKYIKKVACYPERITYRDFLDTGYRLLPSEKCHIALLTLEARKQAELVYALNVINKILT